MIFRNLLLRPAICIALLGTIVLGFTACSSAPKSYSYRFVHSKTTILSNARKAYPPRRSPRAVKLAIAAGNRLQNKGYRHGGGHRRIEDHSYDCSGTVSYVLIKAGLLDAPLPSKAFKKYGRRGKGKWITVWAKDGHTFITIGGLRLDTGWGSQGEGPRWHTSSRPAKGYVLRHPPGL